MSLMDRLAEIKLLITDVDGVMTDTGVYYNENGDAMRRFSVRDGMGVERLRDLVGVETVIISGEDSPSIKKRAEKLKIEEFYLGVKDKVGVLEQIAVQKNLSLKEIAYIGDDLNDLEALRKVGVSACPQDAYDEVLNSCHYVCENKGGYGALREFAELIIKAKTKKEVDDEKGQGG